MSLRCPECRSRRASWESMLRHIDSTRHKLCDCGGGGVYPYPHRPGSRYCVRNPMSGAWLAAYHGAEGEERAEVFAAVAFSTPGKAGNHCPF